MIDCNANEKRFERSVAPEVANCGRQRDKNIVNQIFRCLEIAEETPGKCPHGSGELVIRFGYRLDIPFSNPAN